MDRASFTDSSPQVSSRSGRRRSWSPPPSPLEKRARVLATPSDTAFDWQPLPPYLFVPQGDGWPRVIGPLQDGSLGPRPDLEAKRTRDESGGETFLYRRIPVSRRFSSSKPASVSPDSTIDGLSAIPGLPLLSSVNKPIYGLDCGVHGMVLQEQPRYPWSRATSNLPGMWRDGISRRLLKDTASLGLRCPSFPLGCTSLKR